MIFSYTFPFHLVEKGSNIVLYGCGEMGKEYYWQLMETNYCSIVGWTDSRFHGRGEMNKPYFGYEKLPSLDYDYVVIAVGDNSVVVEDIIPFLLGLGVPEEKIVYFVNSRTFLHEKRAFFKDRNMLYPVNKKNSGTLTGQFLCEKVECTACKACINTCKNNAISMIRDELGFFYPMINEEVCTRCNRCHEVCPVINDNRRDEDAKESYVVVEKGKELEMGSSGGVFPTLAKRFLVEGGIVCGAAFDDKLSLRHICIDSIENLQKVCKSKYVQSDIGNAYKEVEKYLKDKKNVLFCGTPCQVAGLYSYLGVDYDNLFTLDLFCHGVPSQEILVNFLKENIDDFEKIKNVNFRNKKKGWKESVGLIECVMEDGTIIDLQENTYIKVFLENIALRQSCNNCKFNLNPRFGDWSIGDAWDYKNMPEEAGRNRGMSYLQINTQKGKNLFEKIDSLNAYRVNDLLMCRNAVNNFRSVSYKKEVFANLYEKYGSVESAYKKASEEKYDVVIVGGYSWTNYGDEITYYSLYKLLTGWGLKCLMANWNHEAEWPVYVEPILFENSPYPIGAVNYCVETRERMKSKLNEMSDVFLVGSGQYVNPDIMGYTDDICLLDWVDDDKKKVAYSASFGHEKIKLDDKRKNRFTEAFKRFDAFAVREKSALDITKEWFGLESEWVLDPVFLADKSVFDEIIGARGPKCKELFAYILDPSDNNEKILRRINKKLGLEYSIISAGSRSKENAESLWSLPVIGNAKIEEWVMHLRDSEFVVTDSFHAMCMAIIFRKPFIVVVNKLRGETRYGDFLRKIGLESHMIYSYEDITDELIAETIDYTKKVFEILNEEIEQCKKWLKEKLS